jgi:pilus assembly protein CpaC
MNVTMSPNRRCTSQFRALSLLLLALSVPTILARPASAQEDVRTESEGVITIARGATAIVTRPDSITRISIADPGIADFVLFPPNQLLVNAIGVGTTSLVVWGSFGQPRMLTVEVTADIASLQRQLDDLFPDAGLQVGSTGSTMVLSGEVRDPQVVRKALEVAGTFQIPVVNNIHAPPPEQILLHVEFAEISRSVVKELGTDLLRVINPAQADHLFDNAEAGDRSLAEDPLTQSIESVSEGFITIALQDNRSALDGILRVLKNNGEFRSLAQPNLVTREGQEATFLAGGEFPFPSIQGGGSSNAVTVVWKEYGIRLNFTPVITNSGNIRLQVSPEVSSLDFANGLTFQGFNIPSILSRRVETDVELKPGQTLAIGGLMDNTMLSEVDKIPILGDIPIIGFFFKSKGARENRTELLVLVTPYVLDSDNLPAPDLPTGDALEWEWDGYIGNWIRERADTTRVGGN